MSDADPMGRLFELARDTVDWLEKILPAQALNRDFDAAVRRTEDYLQCPIHGGRCTCDQTTPKFGDAYERANPDWVGWATPAIMTVLHVHFPQQSPSGYDCNPGTEACPLWPDEQAWLEHVAPLVAARIGCDPQRAMAALSRYKPDRV